MKRNGAVHIKQKKVVKKFIENNGNLSKAMKESGYSDAYAHNQDITDTKTWKELIAEMLPDEELTKKHRELLHAKKPVFVKGIPIDIELDDYDIQSKALDMGYKLSGKYAPDKVQVVSPYEDMSLDEIDDEIEKLEREKKRAKAK